MASTIVEREFTVRVYAQGEDVGGTVDFEIDSSMLQEPLEIGGSTARPIQGTAESMPYAIKFVDRAGTIVSQLWDGNGRPQVLGRVVEVLVTENGSQATSDVRRLGSLRATDPPIVELHLVDETAFDRVTLFDLNPLIAMNVNGDVNDDHSLPPGPTWGPIQVVLTTSVSITSASGDFRRLSTGGLVVSRLPQYEAVLDDVIASPSGSNTSGNFTTLLCQTAGATERPITSFGALSAATREDVVNAGAWQDAAQPDTYRKVPDCWIHWPGGPASGSVAVRFYFSDPGVPTSEGMPYLIEEAGIRDLLAAIMDGSYGGGSMRFQLPSTSILPNDLLGGAITLALTRPWVRRELLAAIAKVAGLVLWIDEMGRVVPIPWPVPPIADLSQPEIDALYVFGGAAALSPPTYEVKYSSAFNVWRAEGVVVTDIGSVATVSQSPTSPFFRHALFPAQIEEDDSASPPVSTERRVHVAGMEGLIVSTGFIGSGSVAEAFLSATLGGLAEGRIRGHATSDAPLPGELVIVDHEELKGINPATGARSGQQLARVVDRRKSYQGDEVSYEYRLIYGGVA